MGKVKVGMTSDQVLQTLGKPSGRSIVEGEEDPVVKWPYPTRTISFQYREKAWRVVDKHGP